MWFVVWVVAVVLLYLTGRNYGRALYVGLGQRRLLPATFAWWRRAKTRMFAVAGVTAMPREEAGDELLEVASAEESGGAAQAAASAAASVVTLDVAAAVCQQPMDLSVMVDSSGRLDIEHTNTQTCTRHTHTHTHIH